MFEQISFFSEQISFLVGTNIYFDWANIYSVWSCEQISIFVMLSGHLIWLEHGIVYKIALGWLSKNVHHASIVTFEYIYTVMAFAIKKYNSCFTGKGRWIHSNRNKMSMENICIFSIETPLNEKKTVKQIKGSHWDF